MSWTTDAPYRETPEEIAHYRGKGVLTVEMEAGALFAVAHARSIRLASAVVLDAVIGEPISAPTMDTAAAFGKLYAASSSESTCWQTAPSPDGVPTNTQPQIGLPSCSGLAGSMNGRRSSRRHNTQMGSRWSCGSRS